jgi:hypothetical protein
MLITKSLSFGMELESPASDSSAVLQSARHLKQSSWADASNLTGSGVKHACCGGGRAFLTCVIHYCVCVCLCVCVCVCVCVYVCVCMCVCFHTRTSQWS